MYYLALQEKRYKLITRSKLIQSIGSLICQLLLYPIGSLGLIFGFIISNASGFEKLLINEIKYIKKDFLIKIRSVPNTLIGYRDFGFYVTLSSLLEVIGNHGPRLIIFYLFGQKELGFIGMAIGLYNVPIYLSQNTIDTNIQRFYSDTVNNLISQSIN